MTKETDLYFIKVAKRMIKHFGKEETDTVQIDKMGKFVFKQKWLGCFLKTEES